MSLSSQLAMAVRMGGSRCAWVTTECSEFWRKRGNRDKTRSCATQQDDSDTHTEKIQKDLEVDGLFMGLMYLYLYI